MWHGAIAAALFASCYRRPLEIAGQHGLATLAFPSISTGAYGRPIEGAATVAIKTVKSINMGIERRSL